MRYQRDVTRVALLFAAALASAALTTAALGPVVLAGAATTCVNLKVDAATRRALIQAHDRLTPRPFTGPRKGSVYYGRCGSTRYALASFRDRTLPRRAAGADQDLGAAGLLSPSPAQGAKKGSET
jgi:hypothetical protein